LMQRGFGVDIATIRTGKQGDGKRRWQAPTRLSAGGRGHRDKGSCAGKGPARVPAATLPGFSFEEFCFGGILAGGHAWDET
jgi:hypothetical protein